MRVSSSSWTAHGGMRAQRIKSSNPGPCSRARSISTASQRIRASSTVFSEGVLSLSLRRSEAKHVLSMRRNDGRFRSSSQKCSCANARQLCATSLQEGRACITWRMSNTLWTVKRSFNSATHDWDTCGSW